MYGHYCHYATSDWLKRHHRGTLVNSLRRSLSRLGMSDLNIPWLGTTILHHGLTHRKLMSVTLQHTANLKKSHRFLHETSRTGEKRCIPDAYRHTHISKRRVRNVAGWQDCVRDSRLALLRFVSHSQVFQFRMYLTVNVYEES